MISTSYLPLICLGLGLCATLMAYEAFLLKTTKKFAPGDLLCKLVGPDEWDWYRIVRVVKVNRVTYDLEYCSTPGRIFREYKVTTHRFYDKLGEARR